MQMNQVKNYNELDLWLLRNIRTYLSLGKNLKPTSFCNLGQAHPQSGAWVESIFIDLVLCQAREFPENLYWDFDYLYTYCCSLPEQTLRKTAQKISTLYKLFGKNSPIHFQYAHDFTYGFDWAKWVRKDTKARSSYSPFSLEFLEYMEIRGKQIIQEIGKTKEYPLLSTNSFRNRYSFKRVPSKEQIMMKTLTEQKMIPIQAWLTSGGPASFAFDFHQFRDSISEPTNSI